VTVNYALPTADFNPYSDFDLGCTSKSLAAAAGAPIGDLAWNTKRRTYRIVSRTDWSYAAFEDPTAELATSDVSGFEAVARTLLKRSAPAAHNCTLPGKGAPASPPKSWTFGFSANVINNGLEFSAQTTGGGVFTTKATLTGSASDITQLELPDITLGVTTYCGPDPACAAAAMPRESLTLHVDGNALAFRSDASVSTLELPIAVTSSTYPPCVAGTTGTLTITTTGANSSAPSADVVLDICGSNLFQGTSNIPVIAHISNS